MNQASNISHQINSYRPGFTTEQFFWQHVSQNTDQSPAEKDMSIDTT